MHLVIVESPTKARTITKYLGRGYSVMASVGHVKDLPTSKLGVDLEHDFEPTYDILPGKEKAVGEPALKLRKAAHGALVLPGGQTADRFDRRTILLLVLIGAALFFAGQGKLRRKGRTATPKPLPPQDIAQARALLGVAPDADPAAAWQARASNSTTA